MTFAGGGWAPDVVFNDWGVLRALRERHPRLSARAGRLLNRGAPRSSGVCRRRARRVPARASTWCAVSWLRPLLALVGVEALEFRPQIHG